MTDTRNPETDRQDPGAVERLAHDDVERAFDKPLTKSQVLAKAGPLIKQARGRRCACAARETPPPSRVARAPRRPASLNPCSAHPADSGHRHASTCSRSPMRS
jgi:hypothetical protein